MADQICVKNNEKLCSQCKSLCEYPDDFHKTFRKYQTSSGLEEMFYYYHAACKKCRNEKRRIRRKIKRTKKNQEEN